MSPSRTVVHVACLVEDALARLSASSVCVCACSGTGHTRVISEARKCREHPRCISISCLKWLSSPGVTLAVAPADYLTRKLNLRLKMKQLLF